MAAGSKITPDRIKDLKARVKAECKRRAYSGSVSSYGGTDYDYTTAPATGKQIAAEHYKKIAVPLNKINSSKVSDTDEAGNKITDSKITTMEGFITTLEKRSKTDKSGSDCKSGCTGLCYSCQGSCTGGCTGCSGCGGCDGSCSGSCSGGCSGGCSGCSGTCSGSCMGCNGSCYSGAL